MAELDIRDAQINVISFADSDVICKRDISLYNSKENKHMSSKDNVNNLIK